MPVRKPMSNARRAANKKWNDANLKDRYDRIQIVVPKGEKDLFKESADIAGESLSAYIVESVRQRIAREQRVGDGFGITGRSDRD